MLKFGLVYRNPQHIKKYLSISFIIVDEQVDAKEILIDMTLKRSSIIFILLCICGPAVQAQQTPFVPLDDYNKTIFSSNYSFNLSHLATNNADSPSYDDFPVMRFTPQELLALHDDYLKAPKAITRPSVPYKYPPSGQRFDLLKYFSYVSEERVQDCGDCWVWACTGALETDLAVRRGIKDRLSVQ